MTYYYSNCYKLRGLSPRSNCYTNSIKYSTDIGLASYYENNGKTHSSMAFVGAHDIYKRKIISQNI